MTLGEGKRKVLMLIDEYSSSGTITVDKDLELRMVDFFDLAQKNIAGFKPLIRSFTPTGEESGGTVRCPLPTGYIRAFRTWKGGRISPGYPVAGGELLLPAEDVGGVWVEYFALPRTIPPDAPDDYRFEVDEDAAACMPYFVAAQQLVVDLVVDYAPLLGLYDRMIRTLDVRLPESGGGGVRQALYASGRRGSSLGRQ